MVLNNATLQILKQNSYQILSNPSSSPIHVLGKLADILCISSSNLQLSFIFLVFRLHRLESNRLMIITLYKMSCSNLKRPECAVSVGHACSACSQLQ